MPGQPLSLNLARIVHRLMTSPHGWRVENLRDELEIAPRTYRKYRRILREDFVPFQRRDGTSMLVEVGEGSSRCLRLRPPREIGCSTPNLELHAAAVHFAYSALVSTGNLDLARAAQTLLDDFCTSLRDRDFLLRGMLADADRMFIAETCETEFPFLADAVRAIVNRRQMRLVVDGTNLVAAPLSVVIRRRGCFLIVIADEEIQELAASSIESLEILATCFDYPTATKYEPR